VNETSFYSWYPQYRGELMSLSMTGNVIEGKARVYIENNDRRYLVFDSGRDNIGVTDIYSSILGKRIRHFEDVCEESCVLDGFNRSIYNLVFEVDEGMLEIEKVRYGLRETNKVMPAPQFLEIPNQEIRVGSSLKINLSSFFNTTERGLMYSFISEDKSINVTVEREIATIRPRSAGSSYMYFTVNVNGVKFASNLLRVDALEGDGEGVETVITGNAMKSAGQAGGLSPANLVTLMMFLVGAAFFALLIILPAKYYDITGLAARIDRMRKESTITKSLVDYNLMKAELRRKDMDAGEKVSLVEEMEGAIKQISRKLPKLQALKDFEKKGAEFKEALDDPERAEGIYSELRRVYLKIIESKVAKKEKDRLYRLMKDYYRMLKK
jgi:hypothetical protein